MSKYSKFEFDKSKKRRDCYPAKIECCKPIDNICSTGWEYPSGRCVLYPSNRNLDL